MDGRTHRSRLRHCGSSQCRQYTLVPRLEPTGIPRVSSHPGPDTSKALQGRTHTHKKRPCPTPEWGTPNTHMPSLDRHGKVPSTGTTLRLHGSSWLRWVLAGKSRECPRMWLQAHVGTHLPCPHMRVFHVSHTPARPPRAPGSKAAFRLLGGRGLRGEA